MAELEKSRGTEIHAKKMGRIGRVKGSRAVTEHQQGEAKAGCWMLINQEEEVPPIRHRRGRQVLPS